MYFLFMEWDNNIKQRGTFGYRHNEWEYKYLHSLPVLYIALQEDVNFKLKENIVPYRELDNISQKELEHWFSQKSSDLNPWCTELGLFIDFDTAENKIAELKYLKIWNETIESKFKVDHNMGNLRDLMMNPKHEIYFLNIEYDKLVHKYPLSNLYDEYKNKKNINWITKVCTDNDQQNEDIVWDLANELLVDIINKFIIPKY